MGIEDWGLDFAIYPAGDLQRGWCTEVSVPVRKLAAEVISVCFLSSFMTGKKGPMIVILAGSCIFFGVDAGPHYA